MLIRIFLRDGLAFSGEFDGVVELGRQSDPSEPIYTAQTRGDRARVAFARLDEPTISRRHLEFEPAGAGRVRVRNLSGVNAVQTSGRGDVGPGQAIEAEIPVVLVVGRRTIHVDEAESHEGEGALHGLAQCTLAPGRLTRLPRLQLGLSTASEAQTEGLLRWLQAVMDVWQTAASSSDFFQQAARGVVDVAGLHAGRVLLRDGDNWRVAAAEPASPPGWTPSRRVLQRLRAERRTFWSEPGADASFGASLMGLRVVVAAPILDARGEVIGAIYGERTLEAVDSGAHRVARLDALLLELLATGVAAGLARLEHERAALAARVQFEQFFTPELARELAARPDLLVGQDREVTLLFCDIRGFSRISERLGPADTMRWIGDVMGTLSASVLEHRGVLVDYIGDELIAMWGAPQEEPDHARLACRAAIAMAGRIPELNVRWRDVLGEPMGVGIGVNTGVAQVGNTGSQHKFKYGALGNTVNVASRVQGATRYLRTDVLVTGSTAARLDEEFAMRRVGKVAMINIAGATELFELVPPDRPGWQTLKAGYDLALRRFERGELPDAARSLGLLLAEFPTDGPALLLLSRTVDALFRGGEAVDPVFRLSGK